MRVRRCEGFGLGLSFIAFAFYGGAGFVLGGREGARVCFSRATEATARASHSDASDALAGRRDLERSGSRRREERATYA
jgi:hypothetical protein